MEQIGICQHLSGIVSIKIVDNTVITCCLDQMKKYVLQVNARSELWRILGSYENI